MAEMDRRDFMIAALGGAGLLGASGLLGVNSALASVLPSAAAPVYSRRNIYCLNATSRDVVAYKAAVKAMKALPATDGTSWEAQANIHGAITAPGGMIANACQHNTLFFLSWHRMYLYYFERIARAKSGDPNFALPYWGYSPTGARDLPALFRLPADATNQLYTANRNPAVNAGNLLTASVVDSGVALGQTAFNSFTNSLNGTPHGVVHGAVGGGMGSFAGAGRDPIFWLHHCNIDRLWEIWLGSGGGRVNPTTDNTWMTTPFTFYDETGATVTLTGAQIVDTACQLRYQYESDLCGRIVPLVPPGWWRRYSRFAVYPPALVARLDSLATRPPLPQPVPVTQSQDSVPLGARRTDVALPISAEGKRILAALPRDPSTGGRINLVLDDIRVAGTPQVIYEIYINLPSDVADPVYTSDHFIGHVNLFGPSPRSDHQVKHEPQIVPLALAFLRLRDAKRWSDDTVRVTFIPRGVTERGRPRSILGSRTAATIGRVTIQVQ